MAGHALRAFGLLLFSGALGGFCLSSGAAHYFPAATSQPSDGGGSEGSGGGGGAGGGKAATQHGGIEQDGKGMPVAGAAGSTSAGKAAPEKSGPIEDGEEAPPPPAATVLTENETVAFLAGNTIERADPDGGTHPRYMSRRGWQGDLDAGGHLVAHRWIVRASQVCLVASEQSVVCAAVKIDRAGKPGSGLGAKLGTIALDGGPASPVLRGNVAALPEVIPLIDGLRRLRKAPLAATAAAKGGVLKALIGHPLVEEAREGEAITGVFYDPDGRWVTTTPLVPGARTGLGGVRVTIGAWADRDGQFCLDEPGLELKRRCYAAEQTDQAGFRLVPKPSGAPTVLSLLAEGA